MGAPRLAILALGDDSNANANCVLDHFHALKLHSRHVVHEFNPIGLEDCGFLDFDEFDVISIHYAVKIANRHHLSLRLRDRLRAYRGLKVLFAMDEYQDVDATAAAIRELGVRVHFTCVPPHAIPTIYGDRVAGVDVVPVLTGYVPDRLVGRAVRPLAQREIDIGYRGRALPFWLGTFGQDKRRIGEGVLERASTLGLRCDIAWLESERVYGHAWDDLLASWRSALAVESGTSIVDHDGSIRERTQAYLEAHPDASFDEVGREALAGIDGNVDFKVVSSRVFEAIALRTALVMFPGGYSGVVEPGVHFLVLERDFSNIDAVASALRDTRALQAMVDRAYDDVVAPGGFSYRKLAETFDAAIAHHAGDRGRRNGHSRRFALAVAQKSARRAWMDAVEFGIRGSAAASAVIKDPPLRSLAWRYITSFRDGKMPRPQRAFADLLKLHAIRRAPPPTVLAESRPDGEVRFRGLPAARDDRPSTDDQADAVERAIRDGRMRKLSWDMSLVGDAVELPFAGGRTLRIGRGGVNDLPALATLVNRFPHEGARALAPLFGTTPATPVAVLSAAWADVKAWANENAALVGGLGAVRAASKVLPRRPISLDPAEMRRARVGRLELELQRDAPHAVVEHDRKTIAFGGGRYEVQVLTWDAYPGMAVPALLYTPQDGAGRRPGVVVALGSHGNVATHDAVYSAQRHAGNLALRGFAVFVFASGLCFNGVNGERLENSYIFETYGRLSGSGFTSRSIDVLMYLRAFDLMSRRDGVDPCRIAASGFSYGGRIAYYLALYEPRIAALGIAASAVFEDPDGTRREPSLSSGVPLRFTNGEPENPEGFDEPLLLAPRPFLLVLGNDDPGTSVPLALKAVARLAHAYSPHAPPPEVAVDGGSHHFDGARRRVVEDWLARVLDSRPLIAPAKGVEHDTPVLARSYLERTPAGIGTVTSRSIHAARALAAIAIKPASRDLRHLLRLSTGDPGRPVLLAERGLEVAARRFTASFWLMPLAGGIDAAALAISEVAAEVGSVKLLLLDDIEGPIDGDLDSTSAAVVVYLPGFGPLRSPQEPLGDLAMRIESRLGRTLLGVGVEAVGAAAALAGMLHPGAALEAEAHGPDVSNVVAFATALDERIRRARLFDSVGTFRRFFTGPVPAVVSPTLAIHGLAAEIDIPDLQRMAQGRLVVETESDLQDHVIDLRPGVMRPGC